MTADVNDVSRHSMVGRIPDTQQDVLDLLKANNWINDYVTLDEVQIEFNCDSVQISDKSNNCPIGRVEWGV